MVETIKNRKTTNRRPITPNSPMIKPPIKVPVIVPRAMMASLNDIALATFSFPTRSTIQAIGVGIKDMALNTSNKIIPERRRMKTFPLINPSRKTDNCSNWNNKIKINNSIRYDLK